MNRALIAVTLTSALAALTSCARVKVDPIEVKTIHIVHDVNIRVDKQLDEFFAFQEQGGATQPTTMASTTQPATQATTAAVAGDAK
jgi:hypothetical protein